MRTLSRLVLVALAAALLSACGSSGSGSSTGPIGGFNPGGGPSNACSPGTQVQLANPSPFQTGVPTNLSSVTIVANGNGNALYQSYGSWEVVLANQYGGQAVYGAPLQLVADPNGPHPFGSDYYFSSSLQGQNLTPGTIWEVLLMNDNVGCTLDLQQSFQT